MMRAALIVFGIGALFLVPSLWFLFRVFKADLPGEVESGASRAGDEDVAMIPSEIRSNIVLNGPLAGCFSSSRCPLATCAMHRGSGLLSTSAR